jgi:hypothetical protein
MWVQAAASEEEEEEEEEEESVTPGPRHARHSSYPLLLLRHRTGSASYLFVSVLTINSTRPPPRPPTGVNLVCHL